MSTRTITTTVFGLALGGLLLTGCGTTSPAASANSTGTQTTTASATASPTSGSGSAISPGVTLQDTRWGLSWYEQRTPTEVQTGNAAAGTEPAIVISDGRITLDAQCNSVGGDVTVGDATLTVSSLTGTEMSCGDGRDEMEKLLTDTFVGTVGYTLVDDTLTVTGTDSTLTFVPVTGGGGVPAPSPGPTTGTQPTGTTTGSSEETTVTTAPATSPDGTWLLSGYADATGDHAVPAGVQPKIVLGEGRIGIDAQCNAVGGSVAVTASTLTITGVISTMRACEDPRGAMERLLTSTLEGTVGYTVQDGTLTVTGASTTVTFTR